MPAPEALARWRSSWRSTPTQSALTSGLPRYDGVEDRLAADVGQPEAVAVATDAGDDPGQHAVGVVGVQRPEAQRVHHRDRPRAHRQDVADDAADAGRGALVGLDVRRVVVRLDLERHGVALADVDHAGVLTDAGEHLADRRLLGQLGELLQVHLRALVGAVLAPHDRVHRQLGARRPAAEDLADPGVLVGLEPEVGPGLLAVGVLGGDGDGVECGDAGLWHGANLPARRCGQRSSPSARTSSIGRTAASSSSAWSAIVATPPTRRPTCSALDVVAQRAVVAQPVDDPVVGGAQHLALVLDRRVGVAHRRGDLGRPPLCRLISRDVLLRTSSAAGRAASPRRPAPCRRSRPPSRPRPA